MGSTTITIYFQNGTSKEFTDCTNIGYSPDEIRFDSGGTFWTFKLAGIAGYGQNPPPGGTA